MNRAGASLILVFLSLSCLPALPSRMEFVLGTLCSVNLYEAGTRAEYNAVFARLREIQGIMAFTAASAGAEDREATDLDLINLNAGLRPVVVPGELLDVLEQALYYAELSRGAFDPTIGPLVSLWGIGGENPRVPGAAEIEKALDLVNWRDLVIDRTAGTAFLRRRGQALDLGAIAKGYAADQAAALLNRRRNRRAIIDLGGNILALGKRPGQESWRIGVQDPLEDRGNYLGILRVTNKSVVTSGVYERYFEEGGLRYHHILSTGDGYPVQNDLLSVTIVADRSIDADALSTACFALGPERGLALVEALPNVEAVFVRRDRAVILSSRAPFTLTGEDYFLISTSSISNTR
ncbi:MAG: FAD:protein FMN transferase [Treponema sp.]|jgi:thiamine biosynthesis lipoprotein|nr:FAD:protein FMN transferase [Treponema sp.]